MPRLEFTDREATVHKVIAVSLDLIQLVHWHRFLNSRQIVDSSVAFSGGLCVR